MVSNSKKGYQSNIEMISLTRLLKRIPDKKILAEHIPPPKFSKLSHPLLNPYPGWVNQLKAWGVFGIFSDYLIRKILLILFPSKVKDLKTIAEEGYHDLITAIGAHDDPFGFDTVLPDIPEEDLLEFIKEMEQSLDNFYDRKMHWKPILFGIYRMSCLDRIVRNNELVMPQFSEEQINKCIPFFRAY